MRTKAVWVVLVEPPLNAVIECWVQHLGVKLERCLFHREGSLLGHKPVMKNKTSLGYNKRNVLASEIRTHFPASMPFSLRAQSLRAQSNRPKQQAKATAQSNSPKQQPEAMYTMHVPIKVPSTFYVFDDLPCSGEREDHSSDPKDAFSHSKLEQRIVAWLAFWSGTGSQPVAGMISCRLDPIWGQDGVTIEKDKQVVFVLVCKVAELLLKASVCAQWFGVFNDGSLGEPSFQLSDSILSGLIVSNHEGDALGVLRPIHGKVMGQCLHVSLAITRAYRHANPRCFHGWTMETQIF